MGGMKDIRIVTSPEGATAKECRFYLISAFCRIAKGED
jgi:hypothetical protein